MSDVRLGDIVRLSGKVAIYAPNNKVISDEVGIVVDIPKAWKMMVYVEFPMFDRYACLTKWLTVVGHIGE